MAGTITGVLTRIGVQQGRPQVCKLVLSCTADAADHTLPDTVLNDLAVDSNGTLFDIRGLKIYSLKCFPGSTPPTDATDLVIEDEYGIDLLGGKGTDFIDATTATWITAGPSTSTLPTYITGDITAKITNNDVNSAEFTIVLELVGD